MLNSHPIQYFAPLYAYLNAAPDLEVTALYLSDVSIRGGKDAEFGRHVKWDVDLLAGYRSVFLGEAAHTREPAGFWSLVAPEVWNEVRSGQYDVVWLHGHHYAANLIALMAAKSKGLPIMMRGETHLGLPCRGIKRILRRPLMGALYPWCDRLLAIGSENAAFYRAMGVSDQNIFLVPYSVDNDRFVQSTKLSDKQRVEVRNRYNIPADRAAVLYAAKFTPRKRPGDLLKAARQLKSDNRLPVYGGDGRLRRARAGAAQFLRRPRARECCVHGLRQSVGTASTLWRVRHIRAALGRRALGTCRERSHVCRPSSRGFSRVGCVPDLVRDGVNGYTPAAGDIGGLSRALRRLIEDEGAAAAARASEPRADPGVGLPRVLGGYSLGAGGSAVSQLWTPDRCCGRD